MKALGALLVVAGLLGLLYGGISWTRKDTVIDAGPIEVTTDKRESMALPPLAGAALLIGGIVLLAKK
jgi:hypothetical protein